MEGALLEQPEAADASGATEDAAAQEEAPSVFSVINRYLIGAVDVSDPAEDGSRMLRLYSASGQAIVETAMSSQLCEHIATKLAEVKVIEQGDEDAPA